jgi:hypothetical protein
VTSRRLIVLAAAGAFLLPGCTSLDTSFVDTVRSSEQPATPAPEPAGAEVCPDERAAPDPDRPEVVLDFRLADDGASVTGTERVVFTPDRDVQEMVFRLVPNGPDSAPAGNRLVVDAVRGDDVTDGGYEEAGAADPGGLYVVELEDELAAGESTEVELDFTLSLGSGTFDRFGHDDGLSWWASGAPLLAWEPGRLGPRPVRPPQRGDREQPGRRHPHLRVRAGGPHGPHDRHPRRTVAAPGRPPDVDVDGVGGP